MPKKILVPIDGSGNANRAIDFAADLCAHYDAKLVLLHVVDLRFGRLPDELHQYAESEHLDGPGEVARVIEQMMHSAENRARNGGAEDVECDTRDGDPAENIIAAIKDHAADFVVMGSRGLGTFPSLMLGSVSHKILNAADVPVTIVR